MLAKIICDQFIWYKTDPLYQVLHWVKVNIYVVIAIIYLIGWFFITFYFINKPIRYLDEIIAA